ncbi:MAG: DMT family transporter [Cyanobacteriota bacterium]|jgi:transporter family-2 protein|nr:DMT family transporter [Cyanobacteriota bacterium]
MNTIVVIGLTVLAGVAVIVQGQIMGLITQTLGPLENLCITYAGGALVVGLAALVARGGQLKDWASLPWYAFTPGLLGVIIVSTIGYMVPRLGLVTGFTLFVASQFMVGVLFDHYGWLGAEVRPLDLSRALGLGLVMVGIILLVRPSS